MRFPWSRKPETALAHVATIRAVAAAFDARDTDEYVSLMTEDVVVRPPGFILGQRELRGHDQVKAAFDEGMAALGSQRKLEVSDRRYFLDREDETKVAVINVLTISPQTGETQGTETFGVETALVFTLTPESKVARLDSWPSKAEGLAQLKDPVPIDE